jgi:hypothetical protein
MRRSRLATVGRVVLPLLPQTTTEPLEVMPARITRVGREVRVEQPVERRHLAGIDRDPLSSDMLGHAVHLVR